MIEILRTRSVVRTLLRLSVMVILFAGCSAHGVASIPNAAAATFEIGEQAFLLNGEPLQIRCGEIHYARVPREYWKHRIEMVRATGMNAVCVYLFWNFHERRESEFTWQDQADVAEFCRLAQEAGLWVILRPGPYSCAEWEMGGLPWWLLKHEDIALRSRDSRFVEATRRYFEQVGEQLAPLQVTQGGPILMVQVENEYGFYGDDAAYMGEMKQALLDAGFEVPLFACNPPYSIARGFDPDLFQVVNFGSDPDSVFAALREFQPTGPLMCGEFYPAWFDTWGNPHHDGDPSTYIPTLDKMTAMGASYSIYMVHGGTTFGFWAGADRPFKPDTSSYDYDAPVSEAGWTTDAFFMLRDMVQQHLPDGQRIPEPPARNPVISIPAISFSQQAAVLENLPESIQHTEPQTFETLDVYRAGMVYETKLAPGSAGTLRAEAINDFSWVYLDGVFLGVTDRRSRSFEVPLPERSAESRLQIFVWSMGRINFGPEIHDRKGMHGPVTLISESGESTELLDWAHYPLTLEQSYREQLSYRNVSDDQSAQPRFWRATFDLDKTGDSFLDLSSWGKGVVWVNGHALGRFWNIGPTQTMYLPGPWLKPGENEIVVLDLLGPESPVISGRESPVLDQLRPELDFSGPRRKLRELNLESHLPHQKVSFENSPSKQVVHFDQLARGRYFCLLTQDSWNEEIVASIGEIDLLDSEGQAISHERWTIAYVSSEERHDMDGTAENAIDGQTSSVWSTYFAHNTPDHPHAIVIDLGREEILSGFTLVPAPGTSQRGRIRNAEIFIGDDLVREP